MEEKSQKTQDLHFLVTNDDGYQSPSLALLAEAMRQFGKVSVVAPERDWSGGGHVKTLKRPLRVKKVKLSDGTAAFASDGAPSDCVALALLGLVPQPIDYVVSGINTSANMGHDVTYSGTVTAAMEATIGGVPGIAISLDGGAVSEEERNYPLAAHVASHVIQQVLANGLAKGVFLNVNVPNVADADFQGIQVTRQGLRVYRDQLEHRQDPRGVSYYWIGGDHPDGVPAEGTDIGALANGYASVTPLHLDLTAYHATPDVQAWSWTFEI